MHVRLLCVIKFYLLTYCNFYRRDAMLARVLAIALCLCLSVTSQCSIEVVGCIELVFGMAVSFDQSYTVLRKFW